MRPFIFLAVIISLVAGQANLKTLPVCAVVCVGAGINGTGCAATDVTPLLAPETRNCLTVHFRSFIVSVHHHRYWRFLSHVLHRIAP